MSPFYSFTKLSRRMRSTPPRLTKTLRPTFFAWWWRTWRRWSSACTRLKLCSKSPITWSLMILRLRFWTYSSLNRSWWTPPLTTNSPKNLQTWRLVWESFRWRSSITERTSCQTYLRVKRRRAPRWLMKPMKRLKSTTSRIARWSNKLKNCKLLNRATNLRGQNIMSSKTARMNLSISSKCGISYLTLIFRLSPS